jgi:prepilin-type N-terminal cleavage/methylation domain-containing protein
MRNARGFTLLELSIVLSIIALVTAMAVSSGISIIGTARQSATAQKMAAIDQALMAFRTANDRIPCPGDPTLAPSAANYGYEAGYSAGGVGTGECHTGMTPAANNEASGAAEGSVPTATLGISSDMMYDGWGNHIRYAVATSTTANGIFSGMPVGCDLGTITINDANSKARSTSAVYALISNGANGHGAYTRTGSSTLYNGGSTNANEQANCHCGSTGAFTSFTPTYVQAPYYHDPVTTTDNFDDLVTFKERWWMQTAWDPGGSCPSFWVADTVNNRVRKVNLSTGIITTVAGNGGAGYSGDGGQATAAELYGPWGMALDSSGNVYFGDEVNSRVRKVTVATGIITTVAGNGTAGNIGDGGQATAAELDLVNGVALDSSGNIYIAANCNCIRKVTVSTGIITNVAGNGAGGFGGDGGQATAAQLGAGGVAVDNSSGNFYIADTANSRVRKVTVATGIITTVAGNGTQGYSGDGGQATAAELNNAQKVAIDSTGNIYIGDSLNNSVRKVTVATGIITTVAGNGTGGYSGDGGAATSAELQIPRDVVISGAR